MRPFIPLAIATMTLLASTALMTPASAVPVLEDRSTVLNAAERLVTYQNADGSWPWQITPVRDSCGCQNVAGLTALGMLRAYQLTTNDEFLESAGKTFDYLAAIHNAAPTNRLSAPNVYFMVEYALVTGDVGSIDLARAAYERAVDFRGGPAGIANYILQVRASQGIANLGFWDVGLWAQAASTAGYRSDASEIAAVLNQRQAAELNASNDYFAIGLTGLVEANARSYSDNFQRARDAAARLATIQGEDGEFDDVQTTSYAALAFYSVGDLEAGRAASSWVYSQFDARIQGWPEGGEEYAEIMSEAIQALAAAVVPVPAGPASNVVTTLAAAWADQPNPDDLEDAVPELPTLGEDCAGYPVTDVTPNGKGPALAGPCAPEDSMVYAWVCIGYKDDVDHAGTTLGFPTPALATLHPVQDAGILVAMAEDAAANEFDPANVVAAYSIQDQNSGSPCSQTTP